mmetsp:Transcript_15477/g.25315  ORF Transcript_15477/g.25315 Transcript_15477/m.25315 type:complete len:694 (+) Transcript_15477:129-2210(+)
MSGAKAFAVEVALGDGKVPDWRTVLVQPGWDLSMFIKHVVVLCGAKALPGVRPSVFSVKLRLVRLSSIAQLESDDKLLVCVDGEEPVPYTVLACGSDYFGQLGLGCESGNGRGGCASPEYISSLCVIRITQVACGSCHTMVLTKGGQVLSFGLTANGRLGHGERSPSPPPGDIEDKSSPVQLAPRRVEFPNCERGVFVSCGDTFSLVVVAGEGPGCSNMVYSFGKCGPWLGLGKNFHQCNVVEDVWAPRRVDFPEKINKVYAGLEHCLACADSGSVYSWGVGYDGKLGHVYSSGYIMASGDYGSDEPYFRTSRDLDSVYVGKREKQMGMLLSREDYERLSDDGVFSESENKVEGETKKGLGSEVVSGMRLSGDGAFRGPAIRMSHLSSDMVGEIFETVSRETLQDVMIAAGGEDACRWVFVLPDRRNMHKPRRIISLRGHTAVCGAVGSAHSLVVTNGGKLFAFGDNQDGQLGLGLQLMSTPVPMQVETDIFVTKVACGHSHSVAIASPNHTLYSWGGTEITNVIGRDGEPYVPTPVQHEGGALNMVRDVACGAHHTVLCTFFGHALGFGTGQHGEIGNGSFNGNVEYPSMLETNSPLNKSKSASDLECLDPRKDSNLVITSVSAGGGSETHSGHSMFLCGTFVNKKFWGEPGRCLPTPRRESAFAKKKDRKENRNMCVGFNSVNGDDSCIIS